METTIAVIGTGPGHRDYITGAALKRLQKAQVVVGGERLLQEFALPHQEQYPITKDLKGVLQFIYEQSTTKSVAVLVSGDTGVYSSFISHSLCTACDAISRAILRLSLRDLGIASTSIFFSIRQAFRVKSSGSPGPTPIP